MRRAVAFGALVLLASAHTLLFGCSKAHKEELREREIEAIRAFIKSKGVEPWEVGDILYGAVNQGDTLVPQEGDIIAFLYTAYALTGGAGQMVESNIAADAEAGGLPLASEGPEHFVVGELRLLPGLAEGLSHFAHLNGSGWLGISSEKAFGRKGLGHVPPSTPLCYYIEVVGYTPAAQ